MLAGEDAQATGSLVGGPTEDIEFRLALAAVRQIHRTAEMHRAIGGDPTIPDLGDAGGGIVGGERGALDALVLPKELDRGLVVRRFIENAEQLKIVVREHDGVIAGAEMGGMSAAGRHGETQPLPGATRGIEITDGDDDMIETDEMFERHSWLSLFFLDAFRSRASITTAARQPS